MIVIVVAVAVAVVVVAGALLIGDVHIGCTRTSQTQEHVQVRAEVGARSV